MERCAPTKSLGPVGKRISRLPAMIAPAVNPAETAARRVPVFRRDRNPGRPWYPNRRNYGDAGPCLSTRGGGPKGNVVLPPTLIRLVPSHELLMHE
ncbi:hypothetical protein RZS08_05445 [Arthrospira platensis SPKY1]|nr:hypothetical protein [Arthrospira platensis SPKY1]